MNTQQNEFTIIDNTSTKKTDMNFLASSCSTTKFYQEMHHNRTKGNCTAITTKTATRRSIPVPGPCSAALAKAARFKKNCTLPFSDGCNHCVNDTEA